MPLYEYQCPKCGRFEVLQKYADAPLTVCPTCGAEVHKLLSAPAIQFKGTGWYITDYARKGSGGEAQKGEAGKDAGGGEGAGTKDSGGKDSGGKDAGGKDSGGKDAGGKDSGGKDAGGKDSGGKDAGTSASTDAKTSTSTK